MADSLFYHLLSTGPDQVGPAGSDDGISAEDAAGEEVVNVFYGEHGDPTGGVASQTILTQLFVEHKALLPSFVVGSTELTIQQTPGDLRLPGVTGCVVWNGAVVLGAAISHWISEGIFSLYNKRVLELGSGSGLLASALGSLLEGEGSLVVATEQEDRMPLLRRNLAANSKATKSSQGSSCLEWVYGNGGRVRARELDWFDPSTYVDADIDPEEGFDLVIAADTIYNEPVTLKFVSTLASLCCNSRPDTSSTPAIICLELRTQEIHLVFLEAMLQAGACLWRLHEDTQCPETKTRRVVIYLVDFDASSRDDNAER